MNAKAFSRSILGSIELFEGLDILSSVGAAHPLPVDEGFRHLILHKETQYEEVYNYALNKRLFNIILNDFSIFQYSLLNNDVRCAFFPCPYDTNSPIFEELKMYFNNGVISYEEYAQELSELEVSIGIPPVRYEYSENQYKEIFHPTSHFHIGFHSDNRWALGIILDPHLFSLIISWHYYPEMCRIHDSDELEYLNIICQEIRRKKVELGPVHEDLFSAKEKMLISYV